MLTQRESPSPTQAEFAEVRPRVMLVGPLDSVRSRGLSGDFEVASAAPAEAVAAISALPTDVLMLDGSLPSAALATVLEPLGAPRTQGRPAVLVVTRDGHPPVGLASSHADDFVCAEATLSEVTARIRGALRVRYVLDELARKNGELETLYGRVEAMARRMADELGLASAVQRSLLPPPLAHTRLDLAREFIPFREIGGDYFDLVPLGPDRLALAIGDVMGKGVPAALLAASLKVSLRAQLQAASLPIEQVVARVNRLFHEVTPKGRFASLFFAVLDFEAGRIEYVNAGHDYPFVVRPDGTSIDLVEGGTVLGLVEDSRYARGEAAIVKDDLIVCYSDGVTDRVNAAGELFGVERLKAASQRSRHDPARIALYTLLGEVQGWSAGECASDDMTLVVAKLR